MHRKKKRRRQCCCSRRACKKSCLIWLGCLACFAVARLSWSCLAVCLALPCLGRQQASQGNPQRGAGAEGARPPLWRRPKAASLMRLVGSIGKAKQGRLQGKTNSAEPRQSKPGSRAKSVRAKGPKGPCKGPIHKKRILLHIFS